MGLRGRTPAIEVVQAKPLDNLTPPDWLCDLAKSYWKRHSKNLSDNQLLTTQTADSFALLCDMYARLADFRGQETNKLYLDVFRVYSATAKFFRLLPCDKPGTAVEFRGQNAGEFNF